MEYWNNGILGLKEFCYKNFVPSAFVPLCLKSYIYLMTFSVILLSSGHSHALDNTGIDVAIIMDSSGSMKKTDPQTLRVPAAKLFITLLDQNDRVGIVSFSDRGYPIINLTQIDNEANKNDVLRVAEHISSEGLFTNLYDALNEGYQILSEGGNSERKQVLILMSDGKMDVGNPEKDKKLIDTLRKELIKSLKDNGVKVYTIAFTDHSDKKLLKEIAEDTGGFFNLALTDNDLHHIFTSIFESLKSPDMLPIEGESFHVDKSIEDVTVVATKGSPDTKIFLQSPTGMKISFNEKRDDIKWFVSHNFDMITVKNPAKGQWTILYSTKKDNKAYVVTNLQLLINLDKSSISAGESAYVKAWLEKDSPFSKKGKY